MNKIIISIIGIFVMAGLVYALATFTAAGGDLRVSSLQKGLVGHWALDGESLNNITNRTTDKTPYSNHGTNYGATLTTDQMGQSNRAMSFDGVNDYVDCGNDASLNITDAITISFWAKNLDWYSGYTPVPSRYSNPIWKGKSASPSGWGVMTQDPDNGYGFYAWIGGIWRWVYAPSLTNTSAWNHIVITYDNLGDKKVRIYYNAALKKTSTAYDGGLIDTLAVPFRIGFPYKNYFNGTISEVRIYNRALSEDEIDTLYHSYRPKLSAGSLQKGLVLDMPLNSKYTKDETVGSEIMTDRTPYSNDGQNYGATVGDDYTSFDGVNDYVNCGNIDIPKNGPATIVGWFNFNQFAKARDLNCNLHTQLYQHKANDYLYLGGGGADYFLVGHLLSLDTWYHIALTYNGTHETALLYINGVKYDVYIQSPDTDHALLSPFRISNNNFPGLIDEVRIYNRALSESEIKLLYDKGR